MGFCLDDVADTEDEAWELARRINGDPPSDMDRREFDLLLEIDRLTTQEDPDPAQLRSLVDELMQVMIEEASAGE
jgi:hypothetical protein